MNELVLSLKNYSKTTKIIIMIVVDAALMFACWLIFGPPITVYLSSNFELKLLDIISLNIGNFLFPLLMFFTYGLASGFYRSSIILPPISILNLLIRL